MYPVSTIGALDLGPSPLPSSRLNSMGSLAADTPIYSASDMTEAKTRAGVVGVFIGLGVGWLLWRKR